MSFAAASRESGVPTRRNAELLLLVAAVAIPLAGWAYVEMVMRGRIPPNLISYGLGFGGLFAAAHLVIRRFAPYADPLILPVVALLNGLGLVMIHRIDLGYLIAAERAGDGDLPHGLASTQLLWVAISVILFSLVLLVLRDHRTLQKFTYTSMVVGLVLLVMPLVPGLGYSSEDQGGARISIDVGPFTVQPAEAAKLVLLVFFAGYLVTARDALTLAGRRFLGVDLPRGRDLGPILVAWAVGLCILVFQKDLGTSVLFFGTFVCLLYVATERRSWMILGLALVVVGGTVAYQLFGHVRTRVDNWRDPTRDPFDSSRQLLQSLYSFANGGLTGTGLGMGNPESVSVRYTDFIAAVFGEELGLTGMAVILLLYAILIERGLRTALAAREAFGKLLATGLSVIFALQLFVTVGGVTRLIPSTGLTTPFLSHGGSSLLANYVLVALLIRISDGVRRPPPAAAGFGPAQPLAGAAPVGGTL
jgi:cell division protein FtsW (lipid II flippase)